MRRLHFTCDDEVLDMDRCATCRNPIDETRVIESEGDADIHAACLASRLPQDVLVALLAVVVLALAPPIVVWAG